MKKRMAWVMSFLMAGNMMCSTIGAEEYSFADEAEYVMADCYEADSEMDFEGDFSEDGSDVNETCEDADNAADEFEMSDEEESKTEESETEESFDDYEVSEGEAFLEDEIQADTVDAECIDASEDEILETEEDGFNSSAETLEADEEAVKSGQCGDHVNWYLDESETTPSLILYGTGNMWDYSKDNRPEWDGLGYDYVEIQSGITSVGAYAFYGSTVLEAAEIGTDVTSIGSYAFAECSELWYAYIPMNLKSIGESAFENCSILLDPTVSEYVTSIGARAFSGNSTMDCITIKGNDTEIGEDAFSGCAEGFMIFCNPGSSAEQYAIAHGIPYSAVKKDIGKCDIKLSQTSYTYDGKEKIPTVTVMDGTEVLKENDDYTVMYNNNINAGEASVIIFGNGKYDGIEFIPFNIGKAKATITANGKTFLISNSVDQTYSIGAKVNSGGKLSYKSDKAKVTVSSSGKVVVQKGFSGTATITISAAATNNYNAATKTIKIVVNKRDNEITATGRTLKGSYDKVQYTNVNAKAKGGAKLSFSSDNKNITIDSTGKVTVKKNYTGIAVITIKSAETNYYKAAVKRCRIVVNRKGNTITASNLSVSATNGGARTYSLKASALGGAKLSFDSDNPNITVDSKGYVTVKKSYSGTATITIKSSQTNVYNVTTKKVTVTVNKVNNIIKANNRTLYVNMTQRSTFSIGATVGGGAALSYHSNNDYVVVNAHGVVSIAKGFSGTARITIQSAATSVYKAGSKTITVTVNKRNNTINASGRTINASNSTQSFYLNATTNGGARLSYNTNNASVYVSPTGRVSVSRGFSGSATITITAAATAEYNPASKQIVINVQKLNQTLVFRPTNWSYSAASLKYKAQTFEIIPEQYQGSISVRSLVPLYIQVYKNNGHHMVNVKKGTPAGTYSIQITASGNNIYNSAVKYLTVRVF